jgi:hypothetical protein
MKKRQAVRAIKQSISLDAQGWTLADSSILDSSFRVKQGSQLDQAPWASMLKKFKRLT